MYWCHHIYTLISSTDSYNLSRDDTATQSPGLHRRSQSSQRLAVLFHPLSSASFQRAAGLMQKQNTQENRTVVSSQMKKYFFVSRHVKCQSLQGTKTRMQLHHRSTKGSSCTVKGCKKKTYRSTFF